MLRAVGINLQMSVKLKFRLKNKKILANKKFMSESWKSKRILIKLNDKNTNIKNLSKSLIKKAIIRINKIHWIYKF